MTLFVMILRKEDSQYSQEYRKHPSLFIYEQNNLCRHCIKCVFRRNGKEVIQPQVPLGLPCYDFTPFMKHKVVIVLPKVRLTTSFASHSHGVTGGVYKARERIHRSMLTCDY